MRLHVPVAGVLFALACGTHEEVTAPVSEVYAVAPARQVEQVTLPTLLSPGWHLRSEPALEELGRFGFVSASGTARMQPWSRQPLRGTFVVAVKWGVEPPVEFARLSESGASGELPIPPPNARSIGRCETATGLILVYESAQGRPFDPRVDELVGISSKGNDPRQFPAVQRADNFVISWSSCTGFDTLRAAMQLQHDPHLANVICEGRCCATAFPRTLMTSAHLEVLSSGGTVFTPRIDQSMELPPTIEVNGVTLPLVEGVVATRTLFPWRAGENQVSIRSAALEPWIATVVLPSAPLNLRVLSSLEQVGPVRLAWEGGDWATAFLVSIHPDASVRAFVPEFVWLQKDVQDGVSVPWDGFRSPIATVRLTARHLTSHSMLEPSTIGGLFDLSVHAEQTIQLAPTSP
jgi:hypothetical protein